jgi:hypothetical protein
LEVIEGRDSGGLEGREGRESGGIGLLRNNLVFLHRSRQGIQVEKSLLAASAEAFLRKEESESLRVQEEQYFESIADVEVVG